MLPTEIHAGPGLAAQLARAAYGVALKHGVEGSWIELELEMWAVLSDNLESYEQEQGSATSRDGARNE